MSLYILIGIWISLAIHISGHILIPPFLPAAYQNQYYEQKFKISQLDTAQFKITGLPKDIFWTNNGTIFGKPSTPGQWNIKIAYDSLTQSGSYETLFVIKDGKYSTNSYGNNDDYKQLLQIVFPEDLVFEKSQQQVIEFNSKNGIEPVQWKFITLPDGVQLKDNNKLSVKISKQGFYVLRIQATDFLNNQVQACVTLNVQNSKSTLTQSYSSKTVYEPNENLNRLMEVKQKQTQITKQLNEAANKLGLSGQILKENEEVFQRISNNLIQLQNQAKTIAQNIADTIKTKKEKQQKLKDAIQILSGAEDTLNLAMIQQVSNNNLLADAQTQKAKAQSAYDKTAKDLQNQVKVLDNIQKKLTQKQQQKQASQNLLAQKKLKYSELGQQIVQKQKDLSLKNDEVLKASQQVNSSSEAVRLQQQNLTSESAKYSSIMDNLNSVDSKIQSLLKDIQDLTRQRDSISNQISVLDQNMQNSKATDLFILQEDIKNNELSLEKILFEAIKEWNSIGYTSAFVKDYVSQVKFKGCTNNQYSRVEGVFTIKEASFSDSYYQAESGHRILYGNCTKTSTFKSGDTVVVSGFTAQGVIHADTISRR